MKTIRHQLTKKLLLSFGVLLGLGLLSVYLSMRTALVKQFDATLFAKATAITTVTKQRTARIDVEFSDRFMREFEEQGRDFFQMWRADGESIKRSESLDKANLPRNFGSFEKPRFWNLSFQPGIPLRAVGFGFAPRIPREDRATAKPSELFLVVASDRRELDKTLATLGLVLGGFGALLLVVTGLVVSWVLRRELVPLKTLADQAARIDADSLAIRFPTELLPAELTPITERLNDLLARLERSFERERRFSADVAHELRTPIAELRSLAELALKWPEARSPDTDDEVLAVALQMEGIVTRLLALLRSERGQMSVATERVALAPLVERLWRPYQDGAASRSLNVSFDLPKDATIQTDPVLLHSILANLLENAMEYTPQGGKVCLRGELNGGKYQLLVSNTVQHLSSADVSHFFDRFWRKDAARSGTEHSGLGLPLARAFARALGGDLVAALDGDSQLTLTLSGPTVAAGVRTSLPDRELSSARDV